MKKIIAFFLMFISSATLFAQQKLIVGSFNIPLRSATGNLWEDRKQPIIDFLNYYGWEIFGVQEAQYNQLLDICHLLPNYAYVGVSRDDGSNKGEHSAIIYNQQLFKLIDSGTFWLSETDLHQANKGWDAAYPRICTWGIFEDLRKGKKILFMNTHLDHLGEVSRLESIKLILHKSKEIGKNLPTILTGDFNFDEHSAAYASLSKDGSLKDSYQMSKIVYEPNSTFHGWGQAFKEKSRIDHIFLSKHFRTHKYGILTSTFMGHYLSDHFPIMAEIYW